MLGLKLQFYWNLISQKISIESTQVKNMMSQRFHILDENI